MKRGKTGAGVYQKRRRKKKKRKAARQLLLLRLCAVPKCGKLALKRGRLCSACKKRLQENPFRRLWRKIKSSAKRRGKVFALSWEHFQEVAVAGGYDKGHGRGPDGLQVDRIDPRRGYEDGNIQILTGRQNAQKAQAERKGWRQTKARR